MQSRSSLGRPLSVVALVAVAFASTPGAVRAQSKQRTNGPAAPQEAAPRRAPPAATPPREEPAPEPRVAPPQATPETEAPSAPEFGPETPALDTPLVRLPERDAPPREGSTRLTALAVPTDASRHTDDDAPPHLHGAALAQFGFVAGIAAVVQVSVTEPLLYPSPTALPYIAFLPFLAGLRGQETRTYCANAMWTGPLRDLNGHGRTDDGARLRAARNLARRGIHREPTDDEVVDETGWQIGTADRCNVGQGLGIYAGLPIPFHTSVQFEEGPASRTIYSMFSAGFVWALPLFVTLHAGYSLIAYDEPTATRPDWIYASAITLGIGSNIDIVDFLLGL